MTKHRISPSANPSRAAVAPSRRRFMLATTGLGLVASGVSEQAQAAGTVVEAYASTTSVVAGAGSITLYARDPQASTTTDVSYALNIVRVGSPEVVVMTTTIKLRNQSVPADAYATGCGWPASFSFSVPATWPSGLYLARIGAAPRGCEVPFVVRPAASAAKAKILVQVPFSTMQAYNPYGGKSMYEYNSSGGVAATKVSFDRPLSHQAYETNDPWMTAFVRWLNKNGYRCDFCSTLDLHSDSTVLTGYSLVLTAGHDEYWSRPMREAIDNFVTAKGNLAVFGGNTCWWQVRFEAGTRSKVANRTMVCFKNRALDPVTTEATKTINWIDLQPAWPENATFGLGARSGSVWSNGLARPAIPWGVKQASHWVFAGTGLKANATFGAAQVGYETDALYMTLGADQMPYPAGGDASPAGIRILAAADCTSWASTAAAMGSAAYGGYAVIGIFSRNGTVFNAGAVDWAYGLAQEMNSGTTNTLGIITRNVLNKLQSAYTEPLDTSIRPVRQYSTAQSNGDGRRHMLVIGDLPPAGNWTLDKTAFSGYALAVSGSQPLYRYYANQANGDGRRYFYSVVPNIGYGWTSDGIACHVPGSAISGAVVVYQHHAAQSNGDGWRFLFSTNSAEPGWVLDGPAFYGLAGV